MRWYEYKMEVDDLRASDDLKAKLLAMQPAEEAPRPAKKPKKAIHFPRKALSIAACGLLCGVGLYAAVHSPISLLPAGGAALSSAPETASYAAYSMDDVNSALAAPKMAVPAGGSADAMSARDAGGTGTLSAEAAQTSTNSSTPPTSPSRARTLTPPALPSPTPWRRGGLSGIQQ